MMEDFTTADVLETFMKVKRFYIKIIRSVFYGWKVDEEEVFYDIMVQQAENIAETYDPKKGCSLKSYITSKAYNEARNYFRKWRQLNPSSSFDDELYIDPQTDERIRLSEQRDAICWVLYRSNPVFAEMVMRRLNGERVFKIAKDLGISKGTFHYRWNAFIREAKEILNDNPPPEGFAENFDYRDAFTGWRGGSFPRLK